MNDTDFFILCFQGLFLVRFWRFGQWSEILVDDFLPTLEDQLVYCPALNNSTEFWGPLVEKAYAKYEKLEKKKKDSLLQEQKQGLWQCSEAVPSEGFFSSYRIHKAYEAVEIGNPVSALTDLTGNLCEHFRPDVSSQSQTLFHTMHKSCNRRWGFMPILSRRFSCKVGMWCWLILSLELHLKTDPLSPVNPGLSRAQVQQNHSHFWQIIAGCMEERQKLPHISVWATFGWRYKCVRLWGERKTILDFRMTKLVSVSRIKTNCNNCSRSVRKRRKKWRDLTCFC